MKKTSSDSRSDDNKRFLQDLKKSKLNENDAHLLGFKLLSKEEVHRATGVKIAGYLIPYYNLAGKRTGFTRIRFLDPVIFKKGSKSQRYTQPPKSSPEIYLPRTLKRISWSKVAEDPSIDIFITEGEKKAALMCKLGYPTIGLGGVWSFKSKKLRYELLPGFKSFKWKSRRVTVVFDADLRINDNVLQAEHAFARELLHCGAHPHARILPDNVSDKTGVDDFIVEHGVNAFNELEDMPLEGIDVLRMLNEELVFIDDVSTAFVISSNRFVERNKLVNERYANRTFLTYADGVSKTINAATAWFEWPLRRTAKSLTYAPGQPKFLDDGKYNRWSDWGVKPVKGELRLWAKLLDLLFESNPSIRSWFISWLAYPLQNPGTKMFTAVVLVSRYHGVGKSMLGEIMGKIYGENFSLINERSLRSDFNFWAVNKQFVLGEEITGTGFDRRRDADEVKHLITRESVEVNLKYSPNYSLPDKINYLFTTNHPDAFYIDNRDRRFTIIDIPSEPLDDAFYKKLRNWKNGPGPAALFYHLLNTKINKFDPQKAAPFTSAKDLMSTLSATDPEEFATRLWEDPNGTLTIDNKVIHRELWLLDEIFNIFDPDKRSRASKATLARALIRAGFRNYPTKLDDGSTKRIWPLRDALKWEDKSHEDRAQRFISERKIVKIKSKF